jgi:hypothetical protein
LDKLIGPEIRADRLKIEQTKRQWKRFVLVSFSLSYFTVAENTSSMARSVLQPVLGLS